MPVKVIVTDIEGTTTSISFVKVISFEFIFSTFLEEKKNRNYQWRDDTREKWSTGFSFVCQLLINLFDILQIFLLNAMFIINLLS